MFDHDIRYRIARLTPADAAVAVRTFALMAEVFGEGHEGVSEDYATRLLARDELWALAAFSGTQIVGGITAHELPMTRDESRELFIYDLAVHADHQRQGVGRALVEELQRLAHARGIETVFVPADNDDAHALAFYRALDGEPSPVTLFTFIRTDRAAPARRGGPE